MLALITGASEGLGYQFLVWFLSRGYDVIAVSRNFNSLEDVKKQFPNRKITFFSYDLTKEEDCYALLEKTKTYDIDVFVSNAGMGNITRLEDTDLKKEVDLVKLNDLASLLLVKGMLQQFLVKKKGKVLVVSSAASFSPAPYTSTYQASKVFVSYLVYGLQKELKDRKRKDVTLSLLLTGPLTTSFDKKANLKKYSLKPVSPKKVVDKTLPLFLKGKKVIIYGFKMKLCAFFSKLLPFSFIMMLMQKEKEV